MSSRAQLLTPSNLRLDSRLPLELRSLSFQILPSPPSASSQPNSLSLSTPPAQADGYALVSHGLTRVSASVFGPREAMRTGAFSGSGNSGQPKPGDKATVNVEVGVAGWTERSGTSGSGNGGVKKGGKDRRTIELAASLKATFEPVLLLHLYPRSSIDIYLQILEVDGSLLQAAINATTLSLISAGLPLTDYICALSLASYPSISPSAPPQIPPFTLLTPSVAHDHSNTTGSGSTTLLDLCQQEEQSLPGLTVAVLPRSGKVTLVNLETRVGVGRFEEMLRWGVEGSKVVQGAMEEAVRVWAESLAAPSRNLASLFPGISGGGGGDGPDEDDMEE